MRIARLLVLSLLAAPAVARAEDRYAVLLAGNRAGVQTVERLASGELRIHFEFNDRGRGPKIDERVTLDPRGWPATIDVAGVDYLKGAVDERLRTENGKESWSSDVEKGSAPAGSGFYLSFNGAPAEIGLLASSLLKAPGGSVPLLPEGRAAIEPAGERTVGSGAGRPVRQYLITGIDFQPARVWLDRDGSFFGMVNPWMTVIREGWESAIPALSAAQDESAALRQKALAAKLAHRFPAIAFIHAALFDSVSASVRPGTTVVVSGGKIAAVGRDGSVAIPGDAVTIDAAGKTLLPGLWDMHVHFGSAADGLLDIANGVTTARDMGNDPDALLSWKKQFDDGSAVGPHVELAGLVDGSGPYTAPIKVKVDDEAQARAAVDDYFRRGYAQIKIYSSIKPELMPYIAKLAHAHGMRVSGHVPAFMTAEQFVREGSDEIQHINFLFLNFLFDEVKDTRTPARFTAVAEHGVEIDPSQKRVKKFLDLLKEHRTVVDPTLVAFETMFTGRKGTVSPAYTEIADRMPPQVRRGFLSGSLPIPPGKEKLYADSYRSMLRMVKALFDRGIPIVAGTDDLPGFALARELELYAEAGIPAPQVLRIATLGGARVMHRDGERGSIEPGKTADLVLVAGDPLSDIHDVRNVEVVVKEGVLYRPAEIDAEIGVAPGR